MKCIKFTEKLDDFVDGSLEQKEIVEMEKHMSDCPSCQKLLQEEKDLRQTLKSFPVPEISDLSLERIMHRAKRESTIRKRQSNIISFGLAAAACMVLFLMTDLYQNDHVKIDSNMMNASQVEEVSKTINLVFNCSSNMKQAELTITLPDNIELAAFPGQRQLTWKTDLKSGGNLLPLEIITHQSGTAKITAKIEHNRKSKTQILSMSI